VTTQESDCGRQAHGTIARIAGARRRPGESPQGIDVIDIQNAYFAKLGTNGVWEPDSIANGILRIGWPDSPLAEVVNGNWAAIQARALNVVKTKGAATRDTNALRLICGSSGKDVWITFYRSQLWWGRLADTPVEEDAISKFRRLAGGWRPNDVKGKPLIASNLPGSRRRFKAFGPRFAGSAQSKRFAES
jgi:hypothetical protein